MTMYSKVAPSVSSPTHSTASLRSNVSTVSMGSSTASRVIGATRAHRAPPAWSRNTGAPSLYIGPWQVCAGHCPPKYSRAHSHACFCLLAVRRSLLSAAP